MAKIVLAQPEPTGPMIVEKRVAWFKVNFESPSEFGKGYFEVHLRGYDANGKPFPSTEGFIDTDPLQLATWLTLVSRIRSPSDVDRLILEKLVADGKLAGTIMG